MDDEYKPHDAVQLRAMFRSQAKTQELADGVTLVRADRVFIASPQITGPKLELWVTNGEVAMVVPCDRKTLKRLKLEFELKRTFEARLRSNRSEQHIVALSNLDTRGHGA